MRVNIIGCGPTGMTIAWELSKIPNMNIHVYEKKSGPGGSWWEPPDGTRNLHSIRALFPGSFVNTKDLFREMGLRWSDYFVKMEKYDVFGPLTKNLKPMDYWALTKLSVKVLTFPEKFKKVSLKEAIGPVSKGAAKFLSAVTYNIDGVDWDIMTAYEFVKGYDYVALSSIDTQRTSGAYMSHDMKKAVQAKGVRFHFNKEVLSVSYKSDGGHEVMFADSDSGLSGDLLVLCVDAGPARWLIGDNWGEFASENLNRGKYGAVTVLLKYDRPIKLVSDLEIVAETPWNIIADVLPDGYTVCCVLCNWKAINDVGPGALQDGLVKQLGLPKPKDTKICWGANWDGQQWRHDQTSCVLSTKGPLPFFGANPSVALCGMMSDRSTPFASIEAAVEVGRRFTRNHFGVGNVKRPMLFTNVIILILIFSFIIINGRNWFKNKN